jgi:hypothetical protein
MKPDKVELKDDIRIETRFSGDGYIRNEWCNKCQKRIKFISASMSKDKIVKFISASMSKDKIVKFDYPHECIKEEQNG